MWPTRVEGTVGHRGNRQLGAQSEETKVSERADLGAGASRRSIAGNVMHDLLRALRLSPTQPEGTPGLPEQRRQGAQAEKARVSRAEACETAQGVGALREMLGTFSCALRMSAARLVGTAAR